MIFENGLTCWNGPARSLQVSLECGDTEKVLSVSEPSKCEYLMTMQTSALCDDSALSKNGADKIVHEEL
jgi:protein kinase C substrate 80K-H